MLEGLEIQEVLKSHMFLKQRLDSTYAANSSRKWLGKILNSNEHKPLKELVSYISSGHTPYRHNVKEEGEIDFITVECISDLKLHFDKLKSITNEQFDNEFKKNRLVLNSVLCTIKRRICKAFPVTKDYGDIAFNQDVAFFLPKTELINPVYIATYLCSSVGQALANRQMTEQINPYLSVANLSALPVIILKLEFQKEVENLFIKAENLFELSKKIYKEAENLLLEEIGFKNYQPNREQINVKSFAESFKTSGRLDAEYYQPKYEGFAELLKEYHYGWEPLYKACFLKDTNFNPDAETEYKYIELADIGKTGEITDCTEAVGAELPSRARRKVHTGDVVISSIEGSLSSCAIISKEFNEALCSTGFYVINSEKINSETLLVLFKTAPIQNLLKQGCSGTILTAINKFEFQNIPVPIIAQEIQKEIQQKVCEAFALRQKSEQLLELSKRAVEIAIEESEERAMEFITAAADF